VIDAVFREPSGGNHWAPLQAAETLRQGLLSHLAELRALPVPELLQRRYNKFRVMGRVLETGAQEPLPVA